MKILIIGSGGREHALAWKLAGAGHELWAAPGNPGMTRLATCLAVDASDHDGLVRAAVDGGVELVVIGPEAPLVAGLADRMRAAGLVVLGPGAAGARLEGSKIACKTFMARHGIRTARFFVCDDMAAAEAAIASLGERMVVKADGLAAGKGVVVCASAAEAREAAHAMLVERRFGDAGARVVIEDRLAGRELSVMALTDGERLCVLAQAEDHKAALDGDRGPNTGGMGTVSPCPWVTDALLARIEAEVFAPTLRGLGADGIDYRGVLYAGLMVDADGAPWLLEYNCRFGDPETQPVMARWQGDAAEHLAGAARGRLPDAPPRWDARAAVCVILASAGYPGPITTGCAIHGVDDAEGADVVVFHAGTALRDGALVTAGGRVLGVTALGQDVAAARERAYQAVARIHFDGMHVRRDIGARKETE